MATTEIIQNGEESKDADRGVVALSNYFCCTDEEDKFTAMTMTYNQFPTKLKENNTILDILIREICDAEFTRRLELPESVSSNWDFMSFAAIRNLNWFHLASIHLQNDEDFIWKIMRVLNSDMWKETFWEDYVPSEIHKRYDPLKMFTKTHLQKEFEEATQNIKG